VRDFTPSIILMLDLARGEDLQYNGHNHLNEEVPDGKQKPTLRSSISYKSANLSFLRNDPGK